MRCGVIGERLGHSFSKEIHERLGYCESYELIELAPEELEGFFRRRDFDGINVTIPYKEAVIPYLDGMSGRAEAIGAVNTVVNHGGTLWGDNTDFGGLEALIRRMGLELQGRTVLVAGTGGTSRTAAAVARALGAAEVVRLSRTGRGGAPTYEDAYERYAGAQILINTTPAGMAPDEGGCCADLNRLPGLKGVVDAVYNPLATRLVRQARARGIPAEGGLYMLTAQAVAAAELFTGARFAPETVEGLYREFLFEKRNIVLTGMPGSGKTTLGALLSRRLGRGFIDTDAEIERAIGMPIAEIFRQRGEAFFRDLEAETIRDAARTGGQVIATGGGAVLRTENVDALKQNGAIVFLNRPLADLQPADERPLADSAEKLRALYEARRPVYAAAADVTVPVRGTPEQTAETLLEMLR